ncbi:MAG TPA: hypothetical protein PLV96_02805 [Methanoregulaceae archaeon]|nr:hypothetical protein [Methanoregulaceae archaeon]HQA79709.1 hypothetical protein [Methanoregulaceae archaeon]
MNPWRFIIVRNRFLHEGRYPGNLGAEVVVPESFKTSVGIGIRPCDQLDDSLIVTTLTSIMVHMEKEWFHEPCC